MGYGVTNEGFVLKRLDTILDELHADLTDGFDVNTNVQESSFLNVLVTTFANQIAELWETAQDSYYSKFPATANGVNLDNAVQYGGISRAAAKRTVFPLHCTGDDGTYIPTSAVVGTSTLPQIKLIASQSFKIERANCNKISIVVASESAGTFSIEVGPNTYSYTSSSGEASDVLNGLKTAMAQSGLVLSIDEDKLIVANADNHENMKVVLSSNLTTESVTTVANFMTQDYGRISVPNGLINTIVTNISGFTGVTNEIAPTYGREAETDIELRQSYMAKSALRSNTMIGSIVAELLNNVDGVITASGFENDSNETDDRGLPPHSIEIVVEGGSDSDIANAILKRKAGGIQTYGSTVVDVQGLYGDSIPVRFNRPEFLYTWIKVVLHGDSTVVPTNYKTLSISSILEDTKGMKAGSDLLIQKIAAGIYNNVAGVTFVDFTVASSNSSSYVPSSGDYESENIMATSRQKILIDSARIEVTFVADNS